MLDAEALRQAVDARGFAVVPALVDPSTCAALIAGYGDDGRYRSTVVMERHGYGRGEYRYFRYPLPPPVEALRTALYDALVPLANVWHERLGLARRFPATLPLMLDLCHDHHQERPTALILRYRSGDFNALHQDVYGEIAFPFQATVLLSEPAAFSGGEFVLVESLPRKQSVPHVVPLAQGDCIVIPNRLKPNDKGGRSTFRHGVSELRTGERYTLGVILHDAL